MICKIYINKKTGTTEHIISGPVLLILLELSQTDEPDLL